MGLSDSDGKVSFHTVIHPDFGRDTTIGAIKHSDDLKDILTEAGCSFEQIVISVISWNTFITSENIKQIDLMVLDVEGHELSVISGMRGSMVLPKVLCVEFGHVGFDKLRAELDALGYEYDINSNANAFFVRRDVLGLFAFRRSAYNHFREAEREKLVYDITSKQERIASLERREVEILDAYHNILNSRGWRVLERIRKMLRLGKV